MRNLMVTMFLLTMAMTAGYSESDQSGRFKDVEWNQHFNFQTEYGELIARAKFFEQFGQSSLLAQENQEKNLQELDKLWVYTLQSLCPGVLYGQKTQEKNLHDTGKSWIRAAQSLRIDVLQSEEKAPQS